jgi:hypothetical protein
MFEVRILGKGIGFSCSILETLYKTKAAIRCIKVGYVVTENYVPYVGRSVAFKRCILITNWF